MTRDRAPVAIDLGTSSIRVAVDGQLRREMAAIVAVDELGRTVAVGGAAKQLVGRCERRVALRRPLEAGVVVDPDATERLLAQALVGVGTDRRSPVVLTVPLGCTEVERKAAVEAVEEATRRRDVLVLEEPYAAAIGVGLPVDEPRGSVVVDVGHGITEAVVLAVGGLVSWASVRVGGADIDGAIAASLRSSAGLEVGELTIERVKWTVAAVDPAHRRSQARVVGRDVVRGQPRAHVVRTEDIVDALGRPVRAIVQAVRDALIATPPDLAADVAAGGIVLVGGGALLPGLAQHIAAATGVSVRVAPNPLRSVVAGGWRAGRRRASLARL